MLLCASAVAAERLAGYPVEPKQVSAAGSSSRALVANRLHIAHSAGIMGAAMIASGLYGCAAVHVTSDGVQALASQAAGPCMSTPFLPGDAPFCAELAKTLAIDPPSNLGAAVDETLTVKFPRFARGTDTVRREFASP